MENVKVYRDIFVLTHYFYHRQTAQELAKKYNRSERWIIEQVHNYEPIIKIKKPREVVVALNATFFGRRIDKFGLIIAKDIHKGSPVSYDACVLLIEYRIEYC